MRRVWLQVAAGFAAVMGGAWLIGLWAVGLVLVLSGLAVAADAVLRDSGDRPLPAGSHEAVLERWRRTR